MLYPNMDLLQPLHLLNSLFYLPLACIAFVVCRWLYRVSPLHPLYKFPATSRLACASQLYEFYWNAVRGGQHIFVMQKYHEAYGPILRVGPNELHISDPEFYNICYSTGYKFNAERKFYRGLLGPIDTIPGNTNTAVHRTRRGVLSSFFSKASIQKLDNTICAYIDKFADRVLTENNRSTKGVEIVKLLDCLTVDIISEYAYGESFKALDSSSLDVPLSKGFREAAGVMWYISWFWPVMAIAMALPYHFMKKIAPEGMSGVLAFTHESEEAAKRYLADPEAAKAKSKNKIIFEAISETKNELFTPTLETMSADAVTIMTAGSETTASTLAMVIWQICTNLAIQAKLHSELVQAFPGGTEEITTARCEKLPYLTAMVKEALRCYAPVPAKLPRVVPKEGTSCGETFIPGGTIVSMSVYIVHTNPNIYPNPDNFDPERWIGLKSSAPEEKFLVPFSKGGRGCPGMYLAYAELYSTLAFLVRRFKLSLHPRNTRTGEWSDKFVRGAEGELIISVAEYEK